MVIRKNANKIKRMIKKASCIFLIGHKNLDLDAIGSQIGMLKIVENFNKKAYIIIDDEYHEPGVRKILTELNDVLNIIKSEQVKELKDKNSLLIIHDTNKKELLQNKKIIEDFKNIMIIDHHDIDKNSIDNAYMVNDVETSSTCEMIAELIEEYEIEIEPYYATAILSGIVLDTNNFMLNAKPETFYMAYFLTSLGASAKKVQYLLKQDLEAYIEREKLFYNITTISDKIAITKGSAKTKYRKEDLAKVADTLLFFNNIETSFVIGKIGKDEIGVSARNLGSFDVLKILEKLGGGGSERGGAAVIKNKTIKQVEPTIKHLLTKED